MAWMCSDEEVDARVVPCPRVPGIKEVQVVAKIERYGGEAWEHGAKVFVFWLLPLSWHNHMMVCLTWRLEIGFLV